MAKMRMVLVQSETIKIKYYAMYKIKNGNTKIIIYYELCPVVNISVGPFPGMVWSPIYIMYILNLDTNDSRYEGCYNDNSMGTNADRAMTPKLPDDYSQTITRAINRCYGKHKKYAGIEVNTFNINVRVNSLFSNIKMELKCSHWLGIKSF